MKMGSVKLQEKNVIVPENPVSRFLLSDTRAAWIWLVIRLYVGYEWIQAGWHKITADTWVGAKSGVALESFVKGALTKAESGKDVTGWYATFLQDVVLSHSKLFAYMVAYGEVLVGLGLILGLLTGIAAFFGGMMNASYLFAGTLSSNPLLFVLATWLVLAWKIGGWYGLDRWALRYLGTPWHSRSSSPTKRSAAREIQ
ncbi:DoxX family membrane protein [Paenibacillus chondroitinus]|uniref:DoxX family membrane protein n=1 Tax=Paenibacillus chondroitinus TaxID=59842 RepID=A0ABU6DCN3_9BACL|nr:MULTISPECIES: DoxX family membrane protein [Paenibacillus]MCY9659860.1 DoxX family membrane protein [Paenibacillus anseongense]MEB4795522.1 DoxX family membrane protein [Paenibacillus chondroitinus]